MPDSIASLLVEFVGPSSLLREPHRPSPLPVVGNGPPGTFVLVPVGFKVSLPTDQIVALDDSAGYASVGFGGMRFDGLQAGRLRFTRVRDLKPESELSPDRSGTMLLEPSWVSLVLMDGQPVWP
jgi:hypothetical protein